MSERMRFVSISSRIVSCALPSDACGGKEKPGDVSYSCLHNDRPLRYFLPAQAGFRVQTPKASHQGRRQLRFEF